MFVLKGLSRLILGDREQQELFKVEGGALWKVEEQKQKSKNDKDHLNLLVVNRTRLIKRAQLILQRDERPHEFCLLIKEIRQRYDDDVTDASPGKSSEKLLQITTPLSKQLHFYRRYKSSPDQIIFVWNDPTGIQFEFVMDNGKDEKTMMEMFHLMLVQCYWEQKTGKPGSEAPDDELRQLLIIEEESSNQDTTDQEEDPPLDYDFEKRPSGNPSTKVVFESDPALFYVFDAASNTFIPRAEDPTVAIITKNVSNGPAQFDFSIHDAKDRQIIHHCQRIDPDATLHTDRKNGAFIWCHFTPEAITWTYSLRFILPLSNSSAAVMALSNAIGQAIYEILNAEQMVSRVKGEADQRYLMEGWVEPDIEMTDIDKEVDDDKDSDNSCYSYDSDSDNSHISDDSDKYSNDKFIRPSTPRPHSQDKNQQLTVGYKSNRSFVLRGNSIGVFKHGSSDEDNDEGIQLIADWSGIKTCSGQQTLSPSKMMLHQQDRSLLLLDPHRGNSIHKLDVEYGKVVEEWKVHDQPETTLKSGITAILPDSKYAQLTDQATLIGLNPKSIFRIDPRLAGSKAVAEQSKSYATNNQFSCGATTGAGELAVASEKGEIRLFDQLDKRAKTLLPGFGDSITAIDVTESGRYIIATCKTYLLFICTEIPGMGGALGFRKSMGSTSKPIPKRLQLRPEHVAYLGAPVNFTPARFSTGQSEERAIITSTGPYVITWNLRRVKQGKLYDYQIRKYPEPVVADNFLYGQDRSIVVTLPHHVTMISKKSLTTPSPAIFKGERLTATRRDHKGRTELPISIGSLQLDD